MFYQIKRFSWLAVVVVIAGLLALWGLGVTGDQVAQADSDDFSVEVLEVPPELTARWWQWGYSIPAPINPLADPTGKFCDKGQPDDVWYLAGFLGESAVGLERECEIPDNRPILIPILNLVCLEIDGDDEAFGSLENCLDFVSDEILLFNDPVVLDSLKLTITSDGEQLDLSDQISRVRFDDEFLIKLPGNNIKGLKPPIKPNPSRAQPDGFWVLLKLPPGEHTVNFKAKVENEDYGVDFALDITYQLEIGKKS